MTDEDLYIKIETQWMVESKPEWKKFISSIPTDELIQYLEYIMRVNIFIDDIETTKNELKTRIDISEEKKLEILLLIN